MDPQPPPIAPLAWPLPATTATQVSPAGGSVSARRWPIAGLIIGALITAAFGVAAGAAGATAAAVSTAARLEASGDFARAISIDETIEHSTGLDFVLYQSAASDD